MNGALAFVDTSDCTMMNIAEHYMASDVEWDPTGRYVVTSVSWWSHKVMPPSPPVEVGTSTRTWFTCQKFTWSSLLHRRVLRPAQVDNAYWLWTFQGRLLQKNNKDRFCQLLWRPRPPSLLSADQIKVKKGRLPFFFLLLEVVDSVILTNHYRVSVCVWPLMTTALTPRMRAALQRLIPITI